MIYHRLHRFLKLITQMAVLVSGFWFLVTLTYARSISSSELINNAKQYDGQTVTYGGEAIGDVMARGDYAWVNINDGKNALGIWTEKSFTKDILYTGSYKAQGDWIEVTGVFHRACLQHGGDLDIHAQALRKLASGGLIQERVGLDQRNLAVILLGALCLIWILTLLKRK